MARHCPSGSKGSKVKENNKKRKISRLSKPQWQIPVGLTSGNFDYVNSAAIAIDYDSFLAGHRLNDIDGQVLDRYLPSLDAGLPQGPVVADFGCGNGRTLLPLLNKGYRGIGIDLSGPMLEACRTKSVQVGFGSQLDLFQANLVQLDSFADRVVDAAVCMFSTLGMIHGRPNRHQFLMHVRRMLKPEGRFIVHAHNSLFQIRQLGGLRWATKSLWRSLRGKQEFGDRTANYRGVKNMFIHSFRRNELRRDLKLAGFKSEHWIGVPPGDQPFKIDAPNGLLGDLNWVGWTVVCS